MWDEYESKKKQMGNTEKQFVCDKQLIHRSYSNPKSSFQRTLLLVPPSLAKVGWQKKKYFQSKGRKNRHLLLMVTPRKIIPQHLFNL
jgi:hypothetical protein